jgi:hypothetical protein
MVQKAPEREKGGLDQWRVCGTMMLFGADRLRPFASRYKLPPVFRCLSVARHRVVTELNELLCAFHLICLALVGHRDRGTN